MTKTLLAVSAVVASLSLGAVGVARYCPLGSCPFCQHDPAKASAMLPTDPVHPMFLGCQKGCGTASADERARAHVQPAALGDVTYCPVSGAIFRVTAQSTRRVVDGKTLYFCCDACAGYFDGHQAEVLSRRGLS
jgi:YHS domain-containing protein